MKRITKNDLHLLDGLPELRKNVFREWREIIFKALDVYDKNVSKGRIVETQEEKCIVDKWYQAMLDLEEWAFDEIPEKIKRYL